MNIYDAIIIGAGPAGIFTAITINTKFPEAKTLVIEKNSSAGKKLIISGLGQCNLTNNAKIESFFDRYGDRTAFIKPSLLNFTNNNLISFFNKRGLKTFIAGSGKVFPQPPDSSAVLDILIGECYGCNVEFAFNEQVTEIVLNNDGYFSVVSKNNIYRASAVVIATGGKSYPGTGSTGDGYELARALGHNIKMPTPALAPLYIKDYALGGLAGISFNDAEITVWKNNKKYKYLIGSLLLTHKGISGPAALDISRYVVAGDTITISFTGSKQGAGFEKDFIKTVAGAGNIKVKTFIAKQYSLPKNFVDTLCGLNGIGDISCSQLSKEKRAGIIKSLSSFEMVVSSTGGFNVAMATHGGVSVEEINAKTMESRLIKNLYFAGEVIDIDGDTGGYNLQAAFSTAVLAGISVSKKLGLLKQ